jgi:hypothetical protein
MSPADASPGPGQNARPSTRPVADFARSITRLIYTQNPFYLLSVAFVLHSTRLCYRQGTGPFDPWPLMALIGGYILLVAATGFVVVRFGKVWDDARSIFLILCTWQLSRESPSAMPTSCGVEPGFLAAWRACVYSRAGCCTTSRAI